MKDLPKAYNPREVEDDIYKKWEASGFFNPDNLVNAGDHYWKAKNYSVAMPPPNVTGVLHLGHALEQSLMDAAIRYQRMLGKKTLLLPGTDHAAIATQNVVERKLWEQEKKTRHDLGREEFLSRVRAFVEENKGTIQKQIRKMGTSCDWSREKYTFSNELSLAVRTVFKKMYDDGLIYRGKRIVNWCPRCGTTLADDEIEYKTVNDKLYYIRYAIENEDNTITVATVRPETLLGDTAIAVNPKDSRYKNLVGKQAILPMLNRGLPIVADDHVDPEFGSGAVKVTPGHDSNDFEIAQRHKLEIINLFDKQGKISNKEALDYGFDEYAGLTPKEAREQIVKDLESGNFIEKTEELTHNVGFCYRCNTVIEPIISEQWFVSVNKKLSGQKATLKELMKNAVTTGHNKDPKQKIKINPKGFEKTYLHWIDNLHDWNISRQIWWGHQIPVWYKGDETYVGVEAPEGDGWEQDPDTLDTWFSSSLWTFSTLGWPQQTEDLKSFHPTSWIQMGYEILLLWMARMILMSTYLLDEIPFREVYFHGLLRDEKGNKFSKSLGHSVDPIETIEKFGTDALRLSVLAGVSPGNDAKFYDKKVEHYKNFVNKLWNVSRYILQNSSAEIPAGNFRGETETLAEEWILSELNELTKKVCTDMDKYQFSQAIERLEEFTWNKFADWYLEISKIEEKTKELLSYILVQLLKLWHPFIPFVTEHIWSLLSSELLMIQAYPEEIKIKDKGGKTRKQFQKLQDLISGLRNLRAEYKVTPKKQVAAYIDDLEKKSEWIKEQLPIIERLASVKMNLDKVPDDKKIPYFVWGKVKVYLVIPNFDPKKELSRAEKDLNRATEQITRLDTQLKNKSFTKKAPKEVIEKMQEQRAEHNTHAEKLKEKIKFLK